MRGVRVTSVILRLFTEDLVSKEQFSTVARVYQLSIYKTDIVSSKTYKPS